ncbi:MAG: TonB-dependent receptor [Candidatus Manganitrophus sp.]|nr:MAG: TonB-dependent receptor [Candidatus Manganitrophus sp.]
MTPFQWRIAFCSFLVLIAVSTKVSGAEETSPEEIPTFPPVFVTATQTEVPLKETAASVTLIDEKTIEEKHLTTVEEALREVPGLAVVQSGGLGGTTSVFIRGTNPDHTLVLIDGVQVNSPFSGFFDFANLTVDNIERIEVIRGPQSTLYGSDAVGGVIQIFTKKGQGPPTGSLSFEAGAYRTFRETAGVSGSTERFDYSLSAGRIDSQGFSRAAGGREDDGYENTTLSSRLGFDLTSQTRLEWTGRYTDSESDLDSPPTDIPNFVQAEQNGATSLTLLTTFSEGWRQELKASFNFEELEGSDPAPGSFNNYEFDAQGRRVDWRQHIDLGRTSLLTLGYEYEFQRGESRGGIDDETLTNHAIYAFNQFRLSPIILNLGVRYDDNDRFGNETTYKIESAYLVETTATKVRAAYGTGFHGPTLVDLFFPNFSNPDLKPEESESFEAGVEQSLWNERVQVGATYFQNRIEQLIVFDFVQFIPINLARAKMNGWEFEISAKPTERVGLLANYTLLNTEDEATGEELLRRPRHKASGSLSVRPIDPLLLVLQIRYVGERFDFGGSELDDYTVVNLSGTYAVHRNVSLFARVENLFDREYEEVIGYATAGFSGYGGVKVTF